MSNRLSCKGVAAYATLGALFATPLIIAAPQAGVNDEGASNKTTTGFVYEYASTRAFEQGSTGGGTIGDGGVAGGVPTVSSGFEVADLCSPTHLGTGYIGGGANASDNCGSNGVCGPANCAGLFHNSVNACDDPPDCNICWINPSSPAVINDPSEALSGDQFLRYTFDPAQPEGSAAARNWIFSRDVILPGCECQGCGDITMCCDPDDADGWDPANACCLPEGNVNLSFWLKVDFEPLPPSIAGGGGPGACCGVGITGCEDGLDQANCELAGGTYMGEGILCSQPALCTGCVGSANDCFANSNPPSPGCDDAECCAIVCDESQGGTPFCCDTVWDQGCADAAFVACGEDLPLNQFTVQPQAPTQGLLTTRMSLLTNGFIQVGDDDDPTDDVFILVQTDTRWTDEIGTWVEIRICLDDPAVMYDPQDIRPGRMRYFYNGSQMYSTAVSEGGLGGGAFAGTIIEEALISMGPPGGTGNFNDGWSFSIDDFLIEPSACPEESGACCFDDDSCMLLTNSGCIASGGLFSGNLSSCTTEQCDITLTCNENSTGACDVAHGGLGCVLEDCCNTVCNNDDPTCCTVAWDADCVAFAVQSCVLFNCDADQNTQCQAPGTFTALSSIPEVASTADKFTAADNDTITSVCWFGLYGDGGNEADDFTINYYNCADGLPVDEDDMTDILDPLASFSGGSLTVGFKGATNLTFGEDSVFEYNATHAPVAVTAGSSYFIEIINNSIEIATNNWFWVASSSSEVGDGISLQKLPNPKEGPQPYARWDRVGQDVSYCLDIVLLPTADECALPEADTDCQLDLADANFQENEPCGADPDQNLFCSTGPPDGPVTDLGVAPSSAATALVIHGVAFADDNGRDTDWYRFTTPDVDTNGDDEVFACVTIASELPMEADMLLNDPAMGGDITCENAFIFNQEAVGFNCGALLALGYPLAPGTANAIRARPADGEGVFNGYPCPPGGVATLCFADANRDGTVSVPDLTACILDWGTDGSANNADHNCDGTVSVPDLTACILNWGACNPPPEECGGGQNDYLIELYVVDTFEECFPDRP